MVGGAGQLWHQRIEQGTWRLGDGLEHLAVQRPEAFSDLADASVTTNGQEVHAA
jgi:hypothetical protein